jgi:DNA-binding CsgD family transcriptional regulator/tetratricopeptide (TPR) repeat protein
MTVLVGRSAETRTIAALLDAATGAPAALIIEGEPGIGKTTLWLDALQRARQKGIQVLAARASAAESVLAYAALADLLADVDATVWADLPTPQRHGLASALLREDHTAATFVDQRAVGAAFLAVLDLLAAESTVVVAIDDLQWLDASSAGAIAFAARRLAGRVVVLCTARSGSATSSTSWLELAEPGAVHRIRLLPLTVGETHDVIIGQLGDPIPRSRLLRIHHISGGNPFYAVELAREIDQRNSGADLKLPDSLAELTHSRINRIEVGAEDALLAIASLADPTIRAVAQAIDVPPQHLVEMLHAAEAQKIVAIDGYHVRFTHPLLAHAVYLDATSPRRRTMHRRLATVVSEPELRARHLALADPVGEPETLSALDEAADIARGRGAPAAAAELLELAISLGGATERRRIQLAQCLFDSGDLRRARDTLEAAIADMAPGSSRAEALQRLAMVRLYDDSFLEAAELCLRALGDCADDSALSVSVMTTLAFAQLNTGRPDVALTTGQQAVATAERLGPSAPLGRALGMHAILQFMNGEGVDTTDLNRAAALDDPEDLVPVALRPSVQSTLLRGWTGELAAARTTLAQIAQHSQTVGEEGEMMFIAFQLVLFDIWRGDLRLATDTADAALQRARQLGGEAALFLASSVKAGVAAYQGNVEEARRYIATALAAGGGSGYVLMMAWTVALQGFLELSLGEYAKALAALEPLLPMLRLQPRYTEIIGASFVPDAAEALINLGRYDDAEPLVETLERNGARLDRAWMLAVGTRCRAALCAARGDIAAGVKHAHDAIAHHDRIEMPFERARTLLVLGRLERRLRHRRLATAALTEALTIFEDLGTPLWAAQARAELERGTAGRTPSPGLTPTEGRIAELAASGMNNHEIAAALFIARKTVEVNLSRIYRKLGIHSRIELYQVMNDTGGREAAALDAVRQRDQ